MKIYVGVASIGAIALCFGAVGAAELNDFVQPSAAACLRGRGADFGPPPGCSDGPQPHNRTVVVTALSTGTTLTMHTINIVYDAEHFRADSLGNSISRSTST
jgi:hypothetical protein